MVPSGHGSHWNMSLTTEHFNPGWQGLGSQGVFFDLHTFPSLQHQFWAKSRRRKRMATNVCKFPLDSMKFGGYRNCFLFLNLLEGHRRLCLCALEIRTGQHRIIHPELPRKERVLWLLSRKKSEVTVRRNLPRFAKFRRLVGCIGADPCNQNKIILQQFPRYFKNKIK